MHASAAAGSVEEKVSKLGGVYRNKRDGEAHRFIYTQAASNWSRDDKSSNDPISFPQMANVVAQGRCAALSRISWSVV
jgi:hypothetical protein